MDLMWSLIECINVSESAIPFIFNVEFLFFLFLNKVQQQINNWTSRAIVNIHVLTAKNFCGYKKLGYFSFPQCSIATEINAK